MPPSENFINVSHVEGQGVCLRFPRLPRVLIMPFAGLSLALQLSWDLPVLLVFFEDKHFDMRFFAKDDKLIRTVKKEAAKGSRCLWFRFDPPEGEPQEQPPRIQHVLRFRMKDLHRFKSPQVVCVFETPSFFVASQGSTSKWKKAVKKLMGDGGWPKNPSSVAGGFFEEDVAKRILIFTYHSHLYVTTQNYV